MFKRMNPLTVIVAVFLTIGMAVGLPRDCSAESTFPTTSDVILASLAGGRIVWLGPEGERNVVADLGEEPGRLVVSHDEHRAYASVVGSVVVIDLKKNAVVGRVALSGGQSELAIATYGARLYAVHTVTDKPYEANFVVSIIDTASLKIVGQIPLNDLVVSDAVVTPDGAMLYVSHSYYSGRITVIDTAQQAIVGSIATPGQAAAMALTADGRRLYVVQTLENEVLVIDTGTHDTVGSFEVGDKPSDVVLLPGKFNAFTPLTLEASALVANFESQNISMHSGPDVVTVPVRMYPARLAAPTSGLYAYVMHNGDREVGIIDTFSQSSQFVKLSGVPVSLSRQPFASGIGFTGFRKQTYDALAGLVPRRTRVLTALAALATCGGAVTARMTRSFGVILLTSFGLAVVAALMAWLAVPATVPGIEYVYAAHRPLPAVIWPVLALAGGGTLSLTAAVISWVIYARKSRVTSTIADVDSGPRHRPE